MRVFPSLAADRQSGDTYALVLSLYALVAEIGDGAFFTRATRVRRRTRLFQLRDHLDDGLRRPQLYLATVAAIPVTAAQKGG